MKLLNWRKMIILSAGLAFTANTWAVDNIPDKPADYQKLETANLAQLTTLHKKMGFVLSHNYYDFPEIASLVEKAINEFNVAKKAENQAKAAAEKGEWQKAISAALTSQNALDKAASIGKPAKTALAEQGAKQVIDGVVSDTPDDEMVAEGAKLYTNKGCIACHGKDGKVPVMQNYPKLAGQNLDYTVAQMSDIKSGARHNGQSVVMKGIMHTVSDEEMSTISDWLASLDMGIKSEASMDSEGAKLYQSKMCNTCHGQDAKTPLPNYPKIAGQNQAYAVAQMTDIKSGARDNGMTGAMKGIMTMVNEEEIEAIAQWLASLSEPAKEVDVTVTTEPSSVEEDAAVTTEPESISAALTSQNALDKAAKTALAEQDAKQVIEGVVSDTHDEEMVADGATLYSNKGCIACHGPDGKMPLKPNYPKLAGQDSAYATAQMKDIKSEQRDNGESVAMKGMMHLVSDQYMEVIAGWLASLDMGIKSEASMDSEGAKLYQSKMCSTCHGQDAQTPLPNYPKIAGQTQAYLITQMTDIKSGVRDNGMTGAMKGFMTMVNEEEIEAIAQWLASLSEPAKEVDTSKEVTVTTEPDLKPEPVISETQGEEMAEIAEGAQIYTNKGCITCHGKDGKAPILPNYPKLAGQNLDYTVAQMSDIKSGARHNGLSVVMKGIMHTVSDDEMSSIADWLASLPSEGGMASDATLVAKGAELYKSKICHTCHGADAQTPIAPSYPKLSGQNPAYAVAQMTDIKSGARENVQTAGMKGIMGMVNEDDMKAIAQWLASTP